MSRKIRVAAVSMAHEERQPVSMQENLRYVAQTMDDIAPVAPDLVALPEIFPSAGLSGAEQADRHDITFVQDLALRYRVHVVGSLNLERDGRLYNTAVFVDPDGKVIGRYEKIHPTEGEIERGIYPGQVGQGPVCTKIGTVGALICFDANWPGEWQMMAALGANLIVFPSAFPGGRLLQAHALLNGLYVVPATWTLHSGVIDNSGRWLVHADRFSPWVYADVDLERTIFHWDFQGERIREIRAKYGARVLVETFGPEAHFALTPIDPDLHIAEIINEFNLVTYRDYITRATAAQDSARAQAQERV